MAGLLTRLRPQPSSSAANDHSFMTMLILLLAALPLSLAVFAFFLQWRGGDVVDPISRWSPDESLTFQGMESSPLAPVDHSSLQSSACSTFLGHSAAAAAAASFSHIREWNTDIKPKICVTTSTSASLDQILPWMFYHKVIAVSTSFLFVEGKAETPAATKALEAIPGVKVIFRTRQLEEQQAKSEIKLEEAAVLHYTYAKFSDLTSRRGRCGCKPTKEDVKRCFMLEFDRSASIIASTATEEEMLAWYRERVVWTDKILNLKLLRKGILTRIYARMMSSTTNSSNTIIQKLRDSGVFAYAIASSEGSSQSRDKLLDSSNIFLNTSHVAEPVLLHSRKIGRNAVSQAKARKLMETLSVFEEVAIHLLSPPVLKDELKHDAW